MKIDRKTLFAVTFTKEDIRYIEAETMEEALKIAREVQKRDFDGCYIRAISVMNPCYRNIDV